MVLSMFGHRSIPCPYCGAEIDLGARSCPSCGLQLKGEDESTKQDTVYLERKEQPGGESWIDRIPPMAIRIFCGTFALFSAAQVAYLVFTFSMSAPTPTADLMSTHAERMNIVGVAVFSIAAVVFGLGAVLDVEGALRWVYGIAAAVVFILFVVLSFVEPAYEVFSDVHGESFIKREIHLLPPGVTQETIPFDEIEVITGEFHKHSESKAAPGSREYYYRFHLFAILDDGRRIEVGEGPKQSENIVPHPQAVSLAQTIAEKSGARLDLYNLYR